MESHATVTKAIRRELRKSLGSRKSRRIGTKSRKGPRSPRPRALLAAKITDMLICSDLATGLRALA